MDKSFFDCSFVIPTRNRLPELGRMLRSLESQETRVREIIVVDGSDRPIEGDLNGFGNLPIRYARCFPPSAAKQRNEGIKRASPNAGLIGFLDDDIVLESEALKSMREFWRSASAEVGGAAFNMLNHPDPYAPRLKSSWPAERLGLYSRTGGKVLPSGFQTMIGFVKEDAFVDWLPSGASVWRTSVFERFRFDEWYEGYSYLEDLDFSYRVGKEYRLAVVADARYRHLQAPAGRGDGIRFGRREVRNRLHFVDKNPELSRGSCRLALGLRMAMSFLQFVRDGRRAHLGRVLGNCIEFFRSS